MQPSLWELAGTGQTLPGTFAGPREMVWLERVINLQIQQVVGVHGCHRPSSLLMRGTDGQPVFPYLHISHKSFLSLSDGLGVRTPRGWGQQASVLRGLRS